MPRRHGNHLGHGVLFRWLLPNQSALLFQAKAAERGSANVSFKDLDKLNQLVKEVGKVGKSKSAQEKLDTFAEELRNKGDNPDSSR